MSFNRKDNLIKESYDYTLYFTKYNCMKKLAFVAFSVAFHRVLLTLKPLSMTHRLKIVQDENSKCF